MNLKALSLASAIVLFATSPMLGQQKKEAATAPKSFVPDRLPLEIKGDRIGETVEQFLSHFPNARCINKSADVRFCWQTKGVLLGDAVTDDSACEHHRYYCDKQGVGASFRKGRMDSLTYRFFGSVHFREFCRAFAAKYGKPDHDYALEAPVGKDLGCYWKQGDVSLFIYSGKVPTHPVIMLTNEAPSKDI